MTTKSIKISEENYKLLVERSAELTKSEGRPISIDKALRACLNGSTKRKSLLDLAELEDDEEFIAAVENAYRTSRKDMGRTW